jgi:hemerythrin-like metal-binding protein
MERIASRHRRLSTGDEQLDAGHAALLAAIAAASEARDETLAPAFIDLVDTLENQFRHEEGLMEIIGLPSIHSHREQHMRVLTALRLAESALALEPWLARHATSLLSDWLEWHVQTQDTVLALALDLASRPPGNEC